VKNMAWRPNKYLLEGSLDNTTPGKVTGWMRFAGMKQKVTFDLEGDFHRDIRGATIRLSGKYRGSEVKAAKEMEGFALHHTGKAGDITAGLPPNDYVDQPYIEVYSDSNGRVVLELEPDQVQVIGTRIPPEQTLPISREEQWENLSQFMVGCAGSMGAARSSEQERKPEGSSRGMKLLTESIRKQLPPLYAQEKLGSKAVAYVKFFSPWSSWTWSATEFDGKDTFFGLVEGYFKELGYFSLSELQSVRGPMGLAIERDLHWTPRTLEEIAPEMFRDSRT
jgi:hypothetical protein